MKKISNTLLVATYNWPEALELVLKSVERQTILPDEVIIADDGSGRETRDLLEERQKNFPVPLKHIWHADEGFRKGMVINRAIALAAGDYILQIDGDIIPQRHFVEDHLRFAAPGSFVAGTRVLLNEPKTKQVLNEKILDIPPFSRGTKNFLNSIRSEPLQKLLGNLYRSSEKEIYYIKGCNMAFWTDDFIRINGYNEDISGWGKEDSELALRLHNAGVRKRYLKFGAVACHLWHREFSREREALNIRLMEKTIAEKLTWCEHGISQYLDKIPVERK
jgi:glycosyltransferase involved in cell wall biosynthesis